MSSFWKNHAALTNDRNLIHGVCEFTQNRFDFGPDGIRDEETSRPDCAPKRVSVENLSLSLEFGNTA